MKLKKLNGTNERTNGDPSIEPTLRERADTFYYEITFILALAKRFLVKIVNLLNKTSNEKSTEK